MQIKEFVRDEGVVSIAVCARVCVRIRQRERERERERERRIKFANRSSCLFFHVLATDLN